ncbi:MAG: sigma-54-dependent Fis family transcriptional regulator [Deltaproteobacteria bacterium]|nr:sigma-54-dependent Fis family transcriptional regulator [Deltaproteobacteria bacterium]
MERARLIVIDDDPTFAEIACRQLRDLSVDVVVAQSGPEGIAEVRRAQAEGTPFDAVLLDFYMPGMNGTQVIQALHALERDMRVILTSGHAPAEVAVEAMRHGAFDFIGKPVTGPDLRMRVERALRESRAALRQARTAPSSGQEQRRPRKSDVIIGGSAWTKEIYERISMVAPTDVTVAVYGESGTGKELVARTIHHLSPRYERQFVVVNCGAIPESLLEDELFGHVKGAFTDASKDREGLLASANGGTLFLDEIGEMPPSLQVKLLRVLQSQEFRRIGEDRDIQVDVRVITATNRDLEKAVQSGAFRQDLYYRINVFPLTLPPLRERKEDIPLLAHHFLLKHRVKVGKKVEGFTPAAMDKLAAYHWPGNVRELENKVHHALVLAQDTQIGPEDIPLELSGPSRVPVIDVARPFRDLKREMVECFERDYTRELLRRHRGNLAAAARQARMDRKNLWSLVKKYRIDLAIFRRG